MFHHFAQQDPDMAAVMPDSRVVRAHMSATGWSRRRTPALTVSRVDPSRNPDFSEKGHTGFAGVSPAHSSGRNSWFHWENSPIVAAALLRSWGLIFGFEDTSSERSPRRPQQEICLEESQGVQTETRRLVVTTCVRYTGRKKSPHYEKAH